MNDNRTNELKFVKSVTTPQNPRDVYHINVESMTRTYYIMCLIASVMIFLFLVS